MAVQLLILGVYLMQYLCHGAIPPIYIRKPLPVVSKPPIIVVKPSIVIKPPVVALPEAKILTKTIRTKFNFARFSPKVAIVLDGVRLNVNNLKLTTRIATKLLQLIGDESNIGERMEVMSMMADVIIAAEKNLKRRPPSRFDVTDLLLFEGDIMLDKSDMLEIMGDGESEEETVADNIPDVIKRMNIPACAPNANRTRITEEFLRNQVGDKATEHEKNLIRAETAKVVCVRVEANATTTPFLLTTTDTPRRVGTKGTQRPGHVTTPPMQKPGRVTITTKQKPGHVTTTPTKKPKPVATTTTKKPKPAATKPTKKPGRAKTTTTKKPGPTKSRAKRKIKASSSAKWSMPIRYRFKSGFMATQRNRIRSAINHWRTQTCVRFLEKSGLFGYHLRFFKGSGCWSKVGRKGFFGQPISIGNNCFSMAVIAHEIGHSLGFWHEQSRPDRDKYVSIKWANIKSGKAHNFKKRSWKQSMTMGIPYDYSSVMHYSRKSFSKNSKDTIVPKSSNYQRTIGQRDKLSFYDVKMINFRYCSSSCSGHSTLKWTSYCRNDGYRDPKSCGRCRCPEGWSGNNCATVKTGSPSTCGSKYRYAVTSYRSLKSPKYDAPPYPANSACQWRIRAPSGTRVRMYFSGTFSFPTPSRACAEYVEVRFGDLARTGPRFCSGTRPTTIFRSHGRYMVLLFRTKTATHRGFHARYRFERCGGCSGSGTQPVCYRTVRYSCRGSYTTGWWWRKRKHYRANTCYRVDRYCCSSHNKIGSLCIPK